MPTEVCYHHLKDFEETKISGNKWSPPPCGRKHCIFQKRVGGLFKVEYEGEKALGFTRNAYCCSDKQNNHVSKEISLCQNPITFNKCFHVLKSNAPLNAIKQDFMSRQRHDYNL